jgi:tripartite-type tricarboxylate transporter receptor subunit TctC
MEPMPPSKTNSVTTSFATTSTKTFTNIIAIAETIPGFDFAPIIAVFAATGTPAAAIERISSEMAAIAKMPEVVQTLSNAGIEAIGGSAAECHRAVLEEVDRLGKAVAQAGIQKE